MEDIMKVDTHLTLPISQEEGDKAMQELEDTGLITIGPSTVKITNKGMEYYRKMAKEKTSLVMFLSILSKIIK